MRRVLSQPPAGFRPRERSSYIVRRVAPDRPAAADPRATPRIGAVRGVRLLLAVAAGLGPSSIAR